MRNFVNQLSNLLWPLPTPAPALARIRSTTQYQRRGAYRLHPGRPGVEPTRFGDWEYNGRCTDFS